MSINNESLEEKHARILRERAEQVKQHEEAKQRRNSDWALQEKLSKTRSDAFYSAQEKYRLSKWPK